MRRRTFPGLLFVVLAALPLAAAHARRAGADLLLAVKGHADAFKLGDRVQEPHDSDAKIWLASDKMRRDEGGLSVIVRLDRQKLYLVNHANRTYSEVNLPIDWKKLIPPRDQDSFERYLADNQIKASLAPSDATKKIRTWTARRFDVELTNQHGLKMTTQMWVTKDLPLYAAYNKMSGTLASMQPASTDWSQKVTLLDGLPVLQETVVSMGSASTKSREELVSAETVEAPPGTYDVPAGFTAIPFDPLRGQQ